MKNTILLFILSCLSAICGILLSLSFFFGVLLGTKQHTSSVINTPTQRLELLANKYSPTPTPTKQPRPVKIVKQTVVVTQIVFVTPTNNYGLLLNNIGCTCEKLQEDNPKELDCEHFDTSAAQSCYETCLKITGKDVYGLDDDNDGIACEK